MIASERSKNTNYFLKALRMNACDVADQIRLTIIGTMKRYEYSLKASQRTMGCI